MLINPGLRDVWQTIIYATEREEEVAGISMYITRFGLAGFSGYQATFMCTIAVVFSLYMILHKYKKIHFYFSMIINLLGNFFYGRVGMMCSFFFIVLFIGYYIIIKKNIKLLLICVVSGFSIFSILLNLYNTNPIISIWINWAFGPFRNWISTGKFGVSSSDTLLNKMYFLPENATLLFGDGKYVLADGSYYMHTDAGFMRLMLYSGIIVQGILYISVLALLISSVCSLRSISKSGFFLMLLFLGFTFVLFEFKGEIFFNFLAVILPIAFFNKEKIITV
jgi:hypothetical protein